jgi:hypothetical protein
MTCRIMAEQAFVQRCFACDLQREVALVLQRYLAAPKGLWVAIYGAAPCVGSPRFLIIFSMSDSDCYRQFRKPRPDY